MKTVRCYAPFGIRPSYYTTDGLTKGETIHAVMAQSHSQRTWDLGGVRNYLARQPDGLHTCFAGIHAIPPGHDLVQTEDHYKIRPSPILPKIDGPLTELLKQSVARLLADGKRAAVALSGGLDSALLVAILRRLGRDDIPVFTLSSGLAGYCERHLTSQTAKLLGVENLQVIETDESQWIAAFPEVIAAAEVPLFNLHPVHRWLLARALRQQGYEVLLTGDGADQVFAGSDPRNYLPIIGALTRAAGLELRSPFFDEILMAAAPAPTPDKSALREVARAWLPEALITRPKTATYAPDLDLSVYWNQSAIHALARQLNLPAPQPCVNAETALWTSFGLLADFIN
ncbi:asparagine synthase-related protein [Prosthecobacter dejongeii]|uniref:asparagine synthase (glutamine-hydrolyzing) n=1 Tax=Prosthecobacter dejongeii TaxID=48465 RepID=A0A7W7YHZ7_9BACT|nr:asparagine synthetase B family protein [Prosthecobacter dejongeii]MBB5036565.1 asparagine synthetase B (glutamine-hydrolyzing) [Prosthecobacter dejongeii]